jgi:hypothetical protein
MFDEPEKGHMGLYVLLAALLAILAGDDRSTIKAVFFAPLQLVRHVKFFLKIATIAVTMQLSEVATGCID